MQSLQSNNTAIFLDLVKALGKSKSKTFSSDYWMPLTLQYNGSIKTSFGPADIYVLFHYFKRQGEIILAPAIHFLFMKDNIFNNLPDQVFPFTYKMDAERVCEESIEFEDGEIKLINPNLQEKHARLANEWMKKIQVRMYR